MQLQMPWCRGTRASAASGLTEMPQSNLGSNYRSQFKNDRRCKYKWWGFYSRCSPHLPRLRTFLRCNHPIWVLTSYNQVPVLLRYSHPILQKSLWLWFKDGFKGWFNHNKILQIQERCAALVYPNFHCDWATNIFFIKFKIWMKLH